MPCPCPPDLGRCGEVSPAAGRHGAPDHGPAARRGDEATVSLFDGAPNQAITLITESGLYKMAMRSDKDEALVFQDWIASEVLPSIRKTGTYALAGPGREAMPLPIDIAEAFGRALADGQGSAPKAKRR